MGISGAMAHLGKAAEAIGISYYLNVFVNLGISMEKIIDSDRVGIERFSVSIPVPQNDTLNSISRETGMSKNELIRHALALLTTSVEAKKKGLDLALSREDKFVGRLVSIL